MGRVQLGRALSKLGVLSRSQTIRAIEEGRITVNGKIIKDASFLLVPEKADIALDGKLISKVSDITILLYKPKGYVTTRCDEQGRKTVYDLLPPYLQHLHPVGRLDMATTGLLLMTTDTQLSNYLTDPVNKIVRTYIVTVTGCITREDLQRLRQGIEDKGELLKAKAVDLRKASQKESHLLVHLTEGKNREIRRMFEALGSEVTSLKRVVFGKLRLSGLEPGEFQKVTQKDIIDG